MAFVNAPDEEQKKIRKRELKKMRKAESWRRKPMTYGVGKVSKQSGQRRMEG
jgi:hypothetical protein